MTPATQIDLYQLTSLVPHYDAGRADLPVTMAFFSRRLPKALDGQPTRGYLLWVGLRRCLAWLSTVRFDEARIQTLLTHPLLGPALRERDDLVERLRRWRFRGDIDAPPEGTALVAGPAVRMDGSPLEIDKVRPAAQTPYLVVRCDLLTAKLIETPLLSIINHMTMVGTKASHVVAAAGDRAVLEFGSRRTHPHAAVDAAYAAWIAGCAGTSNIEAHHRHGVPVLGTMDHFAIQSWEQPGVPRHETERAFFEAFYKAYPKSALLLVDTYDTYGELTGIRNAIRATNGTLSGIRLDSRISVENVRKARAILDAAGATQATIVVSGGMDEHSIRALADAPVDAYGVGERIVTSPDAPVGVGAVGKLSMVDGRPTMKMARGSGKATLPGEVQVYRDADGRDVVACADEKCPGTPLLAPVWRGDAALDLPTAEESRAYAQTSIASLPPEAGAPRFTTVRVSDALARRVESMVTA